MIGRFTKARQCRWRKHMLVWSIGMLIIVPLAMIIFPYMSGMSYSRYSSSFLELLENGGAYIILLIWLLGVIASLLTHIFNPFNDQERPAQGETSEEKVHTNKNSEAR